MDSKPCHGGWISLLFCGLTNNVTSEWIILIGIVVSVSAFVFFLSVIDYKEASQGEVMSVFYRHIDKYELRERLGYGGMGEVWKAEDTQLHRYVAIKVLRADLQNGPNFITRFEREAQLIASLHHPNI